MDVLTVNDNISFHTTVDVLNELFGENYDPKYAMWVKCTFWFRNKTKFVWCISLDAWNKDWRNTMPDPMHLYEEYRGDKGQDPVWNDPNIDKAVFVKKPGGDFHFVGIFRFEGADAKYIRKHERISAVITFSEWIDLERLLNSIGKNTFVKYYEQLENSQDIKCLMKNDKMKNGKNYTTNSLNTKSSVGKKIFKIGLQKEALEIIVKSNKVDEVTRKSASDLLRAMLKKQKEQKKMVLL